MSARAAEPGATGVEPTEPEASDPVPRPPRREVDANSLRGLAHPLRVQICDRLGRFGSATATQLADSLGESSGATSYHLRQLEKYGFVEEDTERGSRRERWWRRVPGGIRINSNELADSPATRDAAMLVVNEFQRAQQARLDHWRKSFGQWPRDWVDRSTEGAFHLRLTLDEMAQFGDELDRLIEGWGDRVRGRRGDDRRDIEVQLSLFPLGDPPTGSDQLTSPPGPSR